MIRRAPSVDLRVAVAPPPARFPALAIWIVSYRTGDWRMDDRAEIAIRVLPPPPPTQMREIRVDFRCSIGDCDSQQIKN